MRMGLEMALINSLSFIFILIMLLNSHSKVNQPQTSNNNHLPTNRINSNSNNNNNNNNQESLSSKLETTISQPSQVDTPLQSSHKSPVSSLGGQLQQTDQLLVGGSSIVSGSSSNSQEISSNAQQTSNQQDSLSDSLSFDQQSSSSPQNVITNSANYCSPQSSSRNLYWNLTRANQIVRQNCPEGSLGKVSWFCDGSASNSAAGGLSSARFSPAWSPDFSQCRLIWLQNLDKQLDRILETRGDLQVPVELLRNQCEQMNAVILTDIALMAKSKELFSDDLRKIDYMLSQIVASFKQLLERQSPGSNRNLFEDLFTKLVDIISSLFDMSQRNAWIELSPIETRRPLEMQFLNNLRESALLLAAIWPNSPGDLQPNVRRANIQAGLSLINNFDNLQNPQLIQNVETNEYNLPSSRTSAFNYLNKLYRHQQQDSSNGDSSSEFKVDTSIVRELVSKGASRFLVLDVKKPDYAMIRQHLEYSFDNLNANNQAEQQLQASWTVQIFGLFAIDYSTPRKVIKNEDILSASGQKSNQQRFNEQIKWSDSLSKWPISVDFKLPTFNQQLLPTQRDCNLLYSDNNSDQQQQQQQISRCQTFKSNSTNHICRCDGFGYISLGSSQMNLLVPTNSIITNDIQWTSNTPSTDNSLNDYLDNSHRNFESYTSSSLPSQQFGSNSSTNKLHPTTNVWQTLFIVFACIIIFITLIAFVISAFLKNSAQSRLGKKHNFFSQTTENNCNSILSHNRNNLQPTTGPLTDHNLIGGGGAGDTIVTSSTGTNSTSDPTTHSTSIIGLNTHQSGCYKTHQQLYASHLPPIDSNRLIGNNKSWISWFPIWLRPTAWMSNLINNLSGGKTNNKGDHIQHHVIASTLINSPSMTYKSQYQNGYTTSLHHPLHHNHNHNHHQHHTLLLSNQSQNSRVPLTSAPTSSSTSSYVSSSAYYEEIGPGNLTKLNPNQISANSTRSSTTIVDPFKRAPPIEQQQLIQTANGIQTMQQPNWHQNAPMPFSLNNSPTNYNDLGQQHSSGSSITTQQSTNSKVPLTPRHYLFASSTAVNAYKSSMAQPVQYNQLQQQQQQTQDNQRFN